LILIRHKLALKKDTHSWSSKCLILSEIRPSLTTSEEGLETQNIYLGTTRIQIWIWMNTIIQPVVFWVAGFSDDSLNE